mgnify:FL=1
MKNRILRPAVMLAAGLLLGVASRLLDLYTQNPGNIFSQMAVWILLGTLISIYSPTPARAMANILPFCLGMLVTYYATAMLTDGVYSRTVIIGWTAFAFCSPALAWLTWKPKEKGVLPKLIGAGVVAVSMLSSLLIFDGLGFHDIIIDLALVYFLFIAKARR